MNGHMNVKMATMSDAFNILTPSVINVLKNV